MARKIVIVRHGERVDFTFGFDWYEKYLDSAGNYTKVNLNMPDFIEKKAGSPDSYYGDSPLTQVGHFQGFLVGKGFREGNLLRPGFVTYSSPAIRSVQTATELLKGMQEEDQSSRKLKIEPALFEWTGFYKERTPSWLSLEELKAAGYQVDDGYQSYMTRERLEEKECCEQYYERSFEFLQYLIDNGVDGYKDKDILLVCHGITIDAATRQLFGGRPRNSEEMMEVIHTRDIPYAAVGILQEEAENEGGKKWWAFQPPGKITMKHNANGDFEADKLFPCVE